MWRFITSLLWLATVAGVEPLWTLSWNAPFLSSSSGYGSEATSFLVGLNASLNHEQWKLAAGLAHGDGVDYEYIESLPQSIYQLFLSADRNQRGLAGTPSIVICHSEPGAWSVPEPLYQSPNACPPPVLDGTYSYQIGRTMFETDRLPSGWESRLNQMDEIWVPTAHHRRIFESHGVNKPVVVVGQGIDVDFWDPSTVNPLEWSSQVDDTKGACSDDDFKFLSVFKWEPRKGPELLLKGFWRAFPNGRGACLVIVTSLYHEDPHRVKNELKKYWNESLDNINDTYDATPRGVVLLTGLSLQNLVRLYRTVDAFVLPTRGEGWGRPYMEAMSMGLPVIATNWSGPTEFIHDDVGYLLPIRKDLVDANLSSFPGHRWADPDMEELVRLLQHLPQHRDEAQDIGKRAREHIVTNWSNVAVAKLVSSHLERLVRTLEPASLDTTEL